MAICEMCGREAQLFTADIEGGELKVCPGCAKYGVVKGNPSGDFKKSYFRPKPIKKEGPDLKVVDNFSVLIKNVREKKGLTREEFSKFLNERESIVAKWEQGSLKPRIGMARRLGKILNMHFLEKDEVGSVEMEKSKKTDELTLGDFIKIKKRK